MKGGNKNNTHDFHEKQNRQEYEAEYLKNNKRVRITFSNTDYAVIEKIATKQGLSVASFIRYATIEQARNLYLFPKDLEEEIKTAVRNMRGIGNNINQIAKYVNEKRLVSPETLESIFNYLLEQEKEIKRIKEIISDQKWGNIPKIARDLKTAKELLRNKSTNNLLLAERIIENTISRVKEINPEKKSTPSFVLYS